MPNHLSDETDAWRRFGVLIASLTFALVAALLSHVVACGSDDDHVSTFERAGKNAVLVACIKDPDDGRDRLIVPDGVPTAIRPAPFVSTGTERGIHRACGLVSRNAAIAHRRTVVLLI